LWIRCGISSSARDDAIGQCGSESVADGYILAGTNQHAVSSSGYRPTARQLHRRVQRGNSGGAYIEAICGLFNCRGRSQKDLRRCVPEPGLSSGSSARRYVRKPFNSGIQPFVGTFDCGVRAAGNPMGCI